jgi:hypothetical protein
VQLSVPGVQLSGLWRTESGRREGIWSDSLLRGSMKSVLHVIIAVAGILVAILEARQRRVRYEAYLERRQRQETS